mmetsp:Transcript_10435/g.15201  ORF Transcript_10435/g.15201 Transcript_10435/m.15201 type:complete len:246 (-) Transcript_10435:23-760(-)
MEPRIRTSFLVFATVGLLLLIEIAEALGDIPYSSEVPGAETPSGSTQPPLWKKIGPVYWSLLQKSPFVTKSLTAGIIAGIGDGLSQLFEYSVFRSLDKFQFRRFLSVAAESAFFSGPLMHIVYDYLEELFPIDTVEGQQKWINSAIQTFLDIAVMNFIWVLSMIVFTAIMEGKMHRISLEMRTEYIPAVKVAWISSIVFAPVQLVSFKSLPVELRVMAMNIQDVVWNASVSYMAHRSRKDKPKIN